MPWREPDPTDPTVLVGVACAAGPEAMREMAWVFAEELARMRMSRRRILSIFRTPFYAGAHQAWRALGETEVTAIVDDCVAAFGAHRAEGG